ncbi:MAG: RHS repeat protein [Xanthomonadales bacterium]|nr:RHS repeat protein [Xanthomonadales bacterium]
MLVLSPGSLLASWEAPRSELRDARNVATTHTYDANGNRLSTQQGEVTRSWSYDGANRVVTSTDGNGKVAKLRYYPTGAVKEREDALGHIVAEVIDARGQVTLRSGPRADQLQSFGYDLAGNVTSETWANGRTLTHGYDELDRRTASVDELGAAGAWDYDADGHLLSETDGGGHQTTFVVNALGHRTEARAPLGRTRTFTVGIHGELLSDTSPLGKVTTHRYDSRGQRIGTTLPSDANAQPKVTTHRYDRCSGAMLAVPRHSAREEFRMSARWVKLPNGNIVDANCVVYVSKPDSYPGMDGDGNDRIDYAVTFGTALTRDTWMTAVGSKDEISALIRQLLGAAT